MHLRYGLGLAVTVLLCVVSTGVQAEIIKRVNPDGSYTYIVPQKVPSVGAPSSDGQLPPQMLARIRERELREAKRHTIPA
jgi:hypothetical protein